MSIGTYRPSRVTSVGCGRCRPCTEWSCSSPNRPCRAGRIANRREAAAGCRAAGCYHPASSRCRRVAEFRRQEALNHRPSPHRSAGVFRRPKAEEAEAEAVRTCRACCPAERRTRCLDNSRPSRCSCRWSARRSDRRPARSGIEVVPCRRARRGRRCSNRRCTRRSRLARGILVWRGSGALPARRARKRRNYPVRRSNCWEPTTRCTSSWGLACSGRRFLRASSPLGFGRHPPGRSGCCAGTARCFPKSASCCHCRSSPGRARTGRRRRGSRSPADK
jgi:hypothetical protein